MGELFAGRYELVDPVGHGVAGTVWRAWDHKRQEYTAAKLLRHADAMPMLRFVREHSYRLDHPHVVVPAGWAGEGERVLFTMPLVRGGSAEDLLDAHGMVPPAWVAVLLDQLLDALGAVHALGIVHRDLKPSNLLLEPTGADRPHLRLSDVGIAAQPGPPRLTKVPEFVGTPGYLAPEQPRGAAPDPRQDLFACGAVAAVLLRGRSPVHEDGVPSPLEPEAPLGIPAPLWAVLRRLAEPDPDRRPLDAAEARSELAGSGCVPDLEAWAAEGLSANAGVAVADRHAAFPVEWGPEGPLEPSEDGWDGAPPVYLRRPGEAVDAEHAERSVEPGQYPSEPEQDAEQEQATEPQEQATEPQEQVPAPERLAAPGEEAPATPDTTTQAEESGRDAGAGLDTGGGRHVESGTGPETAVEREDVTSAGQVTDERGSKSSAAAEPTGTETPEPEPAKTDDTGTARPAGRNRRGRGSRRRAQRHGVAGLDEVVEAVTRTGELPVVREPEPDDRPSSAEETEPAGTAGEQAGPGGRTATDSTPGVPSADTPAPRAGERFPEHSEGRATAGEGPAGEYRLGHGYPRQSVPPRRPQGRPTHYPTAHRRRAPTGPDASGEHPPSQHPGAQRPSRPGRPQPPARRAGTPERPPSEGSGSGQERPAAPRPGQQPRPQQARPQPAPQGRDREAAQGGRGRTKDAGPRNGAPPVWATSEPLPAPVRRRRSGRILRGIAIGATILGLVLLLAAAALLFLR